MTAHLTVIQHTERWIKSVVIDCNFCPFAAKALFKKSIRYVVLDQADKTAALESLKQEMQFLDGDDTMETTLIIFPNDFKDFESYLSLVKQAEQTVSKQGYSGIYQVASFHPDYLFAGSNPDDAANYTNRSVYPMLHLLREESITKVLSTFRDPELIPEHNIAFARNKGLQYMQVLRASCMNN
jgi:hypothetical protein